MTINKSQQFLYFLNKAKHYDVIKNIKSSVKDRLQSKYMKTLSFSQRSNQQKSPNKNKKRLIPLMQQICIKEENQNMINRLMKLYKSQRTEVKVQGDYSRYNREQRKFRSTNPYRDEMNRTIQIGNNQLQERLKRTKAKVGSSIQWKQHFGKTLELKKNVSRYLLQSNKSKTSLHISVVDSYVPKFYESFLNTSSVLESDKKHDKSPPKYIQITQEGLLTLPNIKSKQPAHFIRHTKDNSKIIFDRSRKNINENHNQSGSSLGLSKTKSKQQSSQRKEKRGLLEFKFFEINNPQNQQKVSKKKKQIEDFEIDSTIKFQKSQTSRDMNPDQNENVSIQSKQLQGRTGEAVNQHPNLN